MQGLFGTPKSQPVPSAGLSTSYFFYKDAFQTAPLHNQLQDEDKSDSQMEIRDSAAEAVAVWMRVETGRQKE
ncbi:hypothetical protein ACFVVQ_12810 [Paenibacillus chitinolyticus]|uniref:hypothetical protein n=1 Tax=Paenibacillus chitinolyticus TaxID=79263 RepID=UPI0036DDD15C